MAKATIRDKIVASLKARGFGEVETKSRKYVTFKDGKGEVNRLFFVGKNGALRSGKNASNSIPVPGSFHKRLISEGEALLRGESVETPYNGVITLNA